MLPLTPAVSSPEIPSSEPPRVVDAEFISLDAATQARVCPNAAWHLCVSIWHRDASADGVGRYKQWALLSRQGHPIEQTTLASLHLDAATTAREHSNIVVAPLDRVAALCEFALRLNEYRLESDTVSAAPVSPLPPSAHQTRVDAQGALFADADASGTYMADEELARLEFISRIRDRDAFDAASCSVIADPGDVLLLHPLVYHRTQDALVDRVALITESEVQ